MLVNMSNLQVTKAFNSLVGTSEAIRLLSIKYYTYLQKIIKVSHRTYIRANHQKNPGSNNKAWNQWLAGLIDGDGYFHLTKKGYASLEITMDLRDEHALHIVKNVYGGSIKLVSGMNALRYCLRHKEGFLSLVNDVNGEIRNSNRLLQLNKICLKYEIPLIYPDKLQYENGWLSGLFDSDGSVTLNRSNGQLAISLTQKTTQLLSPLIEIYGGSIYIDRTNNGFKWYISNKESILKLIEYFKKYPSRSLKKNRLHLIPKCYELKDMGAHKATCENAPFLAKSWQLFMNKWDKFEV
uniref:Intronic ORF at intron 3 of nad1 n=1 Tax=Moniliophthora roreri (strain MCA 2997) TaxID=1381753 RepID=F2WVL7_MONRO|nr:intronic ORF at intron 3 of nad1 [Moniliophthora roreri]ADO51577.1 intronic ORF at intron 3 of nad1 [Moniliophthora roreri]